jgi:hypothetical protein
MHYSVDVGRQKATILDRGEAKYAEISNKTFTFRN